MLQKKKLISGRLIKLKIKYMSFDEEEELETGFKIGGENEDEPLDIPEDFGLDEEDPDKDR